MFERFSPHGPADGGSDLLERYLLADIRQTVWVYLARAEYLEKCRIPETYFTDTSGSHEPGYIIPLLASCGRYKYFPQTLYNFNAGCEGHSRPPELSRKLKFAEVYGNLCEKAIDSLPEAIASIQRKARLKNMASLTRYALANRIAKWFPGEDSFKDPFLAEFTESANRLFADEYSFAKEDFIALIDDMLPAMIDRLLGRTPAQGRVIGYGVLGLAASRLLPYLGGSAMEPDELWDIKADGIEVKQPDFLSLSAEDLLLCFPKSYELLEELKKAVPCKVLSFAEIDGYLCFELLLKKNAYIVKEEHIRPKEALGKIKMLVVASTFRYCGGVERYLLNFLHLFPDTKYQIDLQLLDNSQDAARMFDMIPATVNVLPAINQFNRWSQEEMESLRRSGRPEMAAVKDYIHFRNIHPNYAQLPLGLRFEENWKILRLICPFYQGYDTAVAFYAGILLKIIATNTESRKKFAFVHTDYKAASASGIIPEADFLYEKLYYKNVDRIFCVSSQSATSFCEYFNEFEQKVSVLININSRDAMLRFASEYYPKEYSNDVFNILTVARIEETKDIITLLKTADKLKKYFKGFKWFVMGREIEGNDYPQECHRLHKELGLLEYVVFLEERPNPFPYYRHCDLYVQTSLFEGRVLAVEEALFFNLPIITTDYPSTHDQIQDGVNGRICPRDPNILAEVIYQLYRDPKQRGNLAAANANYFGDAGKEKYFEYFG
jgi:glycosyltransferase involved in cell wall biosynthesis